MRDHDAEAELLAILAMAPDALEEAEAAGVVAESHDLPAHQAIHRALRALIVRGEVPGLLGLVRELERTGTLEDAGGQSGVSDVIARPVTSTRIDVAAERVAKCWRARKLRATFVDAVARLEESPEHEADVRDAVDAVLEAQHAADRRRGGADIGTVADAVLAAIDCPPAEPLRIATGWSNLDDALGGGFRAGQLVVIGGSTSVGKSTLALNVALRAATAGHGVYVASLEVSREDVVAQFLATVGPPLRAIDAALDGAATLTHAQRDRLGAVVAEIGQLPLRIDDRSGTVAQLAADVRRYARRHPLRLLVVDYLQLLGVDGEHATREREVAEAAHALKRLALELGIVVVVAAQLNRQATDAEPELWHLRESGAIEQDADVVLLLWRRREEPDRLRLKVAKARRGERNAVVTLRHDGPHARLDEPEPEPIA